MRSKIFSDIVVLILYLYCLLAHFQNVRLAKVALRPGAGDFVNGILRKLVSLKVSLPYFFIFLFSLT